MTPPPLTPWLRDFISATTAALSISGLVCSAVLAYKLDATHADLLSARRENSTLFSYITTLHLEAISLGHASFTPTHEFQWNPTRP